MTQHPYDPLAALGVRLAARGLAFELERDGLQVWNPGADGCCADVPHPGDVIARRRRGADGPWWFVTSWGEPIARDCDVATAALLVADRLGADGGTSAVSR